MVFSIYSRRLFLLSPGQNLLFNPCYKKHKVSIVFIILFLSGQAESQIKSLSANLLQAESDYNAEKFGTRVQNVVPEEKPSPSPQNPHISVSEKNIRIS